MVNKVFDKFITFAFSTLARKTTFGNYRERVTGARDENEMSKIGPIPTVETYTNDPIIRAEKVEISKDTKVLRGLKYSKKVTEDNVLLAGKVVILFSGSSGPNERMMKNIVDIYVNQNLTVYGINYRGFGESRKKTLRGIEYNELPKEEELYSDALTIYDYVLATGVLPENIILHGFSLGGPIASKLVAKISADREHHIGGLILHSSMKDLYSAASDFSMLGAFAGYMGKKCVGKLDTLENLKIIALHDPRLPIHFISGKKKEGDQLSLEHTKLDSLAPNTNITSIIEHGSHLNSFNAVPKEHFSVKNLNLISQIIYKSKNINMTANISKSISEKTLDSLKKSTVERSNKKRAEKSGFVSVTGMSTTKANCEVQRLVTSKNIKLPYM